MADDLTIRTTLVVDGVENVKAAMGEAATAVQTSAQKMAANVNATQEAMRKTIALSLREQNATAEQAAQVYRQLGLSGEQAAKEIAAAFGEVAPAASAATGATDKASAGTRRLQYSVTEARHAATGLGEEIGVRLPRHLSTFLARSESIGPILTRAFSVIAVVALAEALHRLIEKLDHAAKSAVGWSEKTRKAYYDAIAANDQLIERTIQYRAELERVAGTGKEGLAQIAVAQKAAELQTRLTANEVARLQRELTALETERKFTTNPLGYLTRSDEDIARLNARTEELRSRIAALSKELQFGLPLERMRLGAEASIEAARQAMDRIEALASAERTIGLTRVANAETQARQLRAIGQITIAQETAALIAAEEERLEIQRRYFERQRELLLRQQRLTGRSQAPALTRLGGEEEAEILASQARLEAIRRAGAEAQRRQDQEVAQAGIEAARSASLAQIGLEQALAARRLAVRRATIAEEERLQREFEVRRYEVIRRATEARLREAQREPERNKAAIVTLQSELERLAIEHETRLTEIQTDATRQRVERGLEEANLQFASVAAAADRELAMRRRHNDERLAAHRITLGQYQAEETAALNQWYERQREALVRWLNLIKSAYGEASLEYREMLERIRQLDAQRADEIDRLNSQVTEAHRRSIRDVSGEIKRGLTQWIVGYRSFRDAVIGVYASLVERAVGYILELGARHIEEWILETVFHHTQKAQQLANTAASAAAESAIVSTENVGQITSEAAVAAATAYAAYAWNPALAEAMAGEAFAAAMSWAPIAAFEQGGIVPATDIALLHKKEMVLPEPISVMLQKAAAEPGASAVSPPRPVWVSQTNTIQALDARGVAEVLRKNRDELARTIRLAMRQGKLPSF
jgi:hypothetical protein